MQKRTIFIGDVHGCYDELMTLCETIGLQEVDHLYFVGDLINKGPKSFEVVEFVRNRPNTFSVMGNHEYFPLVDFDTFEKILSHGEYLTEGRKAWIRGQYEKSRELRELLEYHGHREWLLSLPHLIERDHFIVVHGGIHPDFGMNTPREIATLIRLHDGKPWYEYYTGDKPIIYGHWAAEGLRIRKNTIGLDTGSCFGGALTAYCLESGEIWQVRANAVYTEPANWKGKSEE